MIATKINYYIKIAFFCSIIMCTSIVTIVYYVQVKILRTIKIQKNTGVINRGETNRDGIYEHWIAGTPLPPTRTP